ncbi:carboxylate-amine ligase [Arthrobacter sp. CAN_A1]|uniref:carboxylate-amine ligase n=1 Tax=Arthrobacter sp. CAN_A1 TaxID=2787717 RepID=UPI0018CB8023
MQPATEPSGGPTARRTFGVEEELLLLDAHTGRPAPLAPLILADVVPSDDDVGELSLELQQQQLEVISRPHTELRDLAAAIHGGRRQADRAAQHVGARVAALATSVHPATLRLAPDGRYARMRELYGLALADHLTCGFHVHVSIDSAEEGVAILDRIRVWLPVLLALSTNSPFWNGLDSGYASYRYPMNLRWPTSGTYEPFGSAWEYQKMVRARLNDGVILDEGMIYIDARLARKHPTVEVRVCDVCLYSDDAVLIAALMRALVEEEVRSWQAGEPAPVATAADLRAASWTASRYGLRGPLVNPLLGGLCDAADAMHLLFERVLPALRDYGDEATVRRLLNQIEQRGTGADRQRQQMRLGPAAVVDDAVNCTQLSPLDWPEPPPPPSAP